MTRLLGLRWLPVVGIGNLLATVIFAAAAIYLVAAQPTRGGALGVRDRGARRAAAADRCDGTRCSRPGPWRRPPCWRS